MSGYKTQVGGNHYTKLKIQPMQYSMGNGLDPLQHTIIKYVTRFRGKGGIDDLHKAKHCLDLLIEHEQASAKTANWPESAEDRVLPIMQNGNDGEHYAEVERVTPDHRLALTPVPMIMKGTSDRPVEPDAKESKKPLTRAELMQQTWFMNSATLEDLDAFIANDVPVESRKGWMQIAIAGRCGFSGKFKEVCSWQGDRTYSHAGNSEIHRIGNNFYWGAPE